VNHVWKKTYAQIANKKRRMIMNNKKMKSMSMRMKASLQHARQRSFWQAERDKQVLRFSPTAWGKLLYFRDKSDNEVGGFGITESEDLLFVKEFVTVKQEVTCVSVKFDDASIADFFDAQVDLGRKPEQFARI